MVIINAHFTKNAIKMAAMTSVILIDIESLIKILNNCELYFNSLVI